MAEFERALIQERVRARIRNARAKGKRLEESIPPKCDQQAWDRHRRQVGYSGSTLVLSAPCQALIAQCDQPGRDICSQGDYRADAREIKHFAHTGL
jgi:hypothetical protein